LAAQVSLDLVRPVDELADLADLVLGEVANLRAPLDPRALDDLVRPGRSDAVDVAERDVHALVAREVDAGDPSHANPPLSLSLLVPGVRADHADHAAPADDLAAIADLLHRRMDLHLVCSLTCTGTRSCRVSGRTATAPPRPDPPAGSGCSASASSPRCGPTRCVRSRAPPGTWRWGAARSPSLRPRSRPSSASSG